MALSFKLEGTILEVKEVLMSWNDTKVSYWYYDIQSWLRSQLGRKDEAPTQPCDPAQIEWVKKHYLPRVQST